MGKVKHTESGKVTDSVEKAEEPVKKELVISKKGVIDSAVTVISLDGDKYHKTGAEFEVGKGTADKLIQLGRVKLKEK